MSIAIVDYGIGNIHSVKGALNQIGAEAEFVSSSAELSDFDALILPGVGGFGEAMDVLQEGGWVDAIRVFTHNDGKAVLGICLGMQLLATSSSEFGQHQGLGLIPGQVENLTDLGCNQRVPHVGWNELRATNTAHPLMRDIPDGADVYFVHSYAYSTLGADAVLAEADYGTRFPCIVSGKRVAGMQFHPEKSAAVGQALLSNFMDWSQC